MSLKCDPAQKIMDDLGFPRTPDRLLKFCGTYVWWLEVFKMITSTCGPYYLGGSATETIKDIPKKEYEKETNSSFRYSGRSCANLFHPHNNFKGASGSSNQNRKSTDSNKATPSKDKATTLMNYRKAKYRCYKCGMKWHPGHKCATSVPLQVVEELWQMLQSDIIANDTYQTKIKTLGRT
jgi:hypothetical protein